MKKLLSATVFSPPNTRATGGSFRFHPASTQTAVVAIARAHSLDRGPLQGRLMLIIGVPVPREDGDGLKHDATGAMRGFDARDV